MSKFRPFVFVVLKGVVTFILAGGIVLIVAGIIGDIKRLQPKMQAARLDRLRPYFEY